MNLRNFLAIALVCAPYSACADDNMALRPSIDPRPTHSVQGHSWAGAYGGVFAGHAKGKSTATETRTLADDATKCDPSSTPGSYNCNLNGQPHIISTPTPAFNLIGDTWDAIIKGKTAGFTVGYNEQKGNIVYGVEADWAYLDSKGVSGPSPASQDDTVLHTAATDYITVRGRVGYASDKWLLFGTAGVASAHFNSWVDDPDIAIGIQTQKTSTQFGAAVGGGVEYALTDRISLKADYLHMQFKPSQVQGYVNITCSTTSCPPQWKMDMAGAAMEGIAAWDIKHSLDVARVGLNIGF